MKLISNESLKSLKIERIILRARNKDSSFFISRRVVVLREAVDMGSLTLQAFTRMIKASLGICRIRALSGQSRDLKKLHIRRVDCHRKLDFSKLLQASRQRIKSPEMSLSHLIATHHLWIHSTKDLKTSSKCPILLWDLRKIKWVAIDQF